VNLFQAANGAATFLILSALVAGLAKQLDKVEGDLLPYARDHKDLICLGIFIVIFRIKTLLDDHRHFAESYQDKSPLRYVGFILAILSWVLWGLAAYLLPSTLLSAQLMGVSIIISTVWVAVHVVEILLDKERRNKEALTNVMRQKWVMINMAYVLCLAAYVGWFQPIVAHGELNALFVLLGFLAFDVLTSRSFVGIVTDPAAK
jgi:small-conductance mechanosensitive channel